MVLIFVAMSGGFACVGGCRSDGLSIGPRDGLFGIPIEFSKQEKKRKSIDDSHESLLADNRPPTSTGRLTGESIGQNGGQSGGRNQTGVASDSTGAGWFDASNAPSADEWFAETNALASTSTPANGRQVEQADEPRRLERQTNPAANAPNEIMQASYVPRDFDATATDASQGITNAGMSSNETAITQAYHNGEQSAAQNMAMPAPVPLTEDRWVFNLEWERFHNGKSEQKPESPWRWRHRGIEEILILPADQQPNWQAMLRHDSPVVRGNTLITLARNGDARAGKALIELANDVSQSRSMRCAAVEALGSLKSTSSETLLQLADTYYDYTDANGDRKGGVPELAVEILHVLTARMPISNEPHFTRPLESRDAKVRLTAVCVWRDKAPNASPGEIAPLQSQSQPQQGRTVLPEIVMQFCGDPNPTMQEAALTAMARWRHPRAMQYLDMGLRNPRASVRCAAVRGLAIMQTSEATALLLTLTNDHASAIRAEVVAAMGQLNLLDNVIRMSDDPDWDVRKAVARELAKSDTPHTRAIAQKYLHDASTQVQTTTLEAMRHWRPESSAPLLFEAMGVNSLETRNLATEMLIRYWEPARQYIPNGRAETRKEQYEQLAARFQRDMQTGGLRDTRHDLQGVENRPSFVDVAANRVMPNHASNRMTPAQRADDGRVRALLTQLQQPGTQQQHQNAMAELVGMGPSVWPVLEQIVIVEGRSLPAVVSRHVLPGLDPLFGTAAKLESDDVGLRRTAVAELIGETKFGDVSPLLHRQLADHALRESDEIVLQRLWDFADLHAEKLAQLDVEWQGNIPQSDAAQQYQDMLARAMATFRKSLTAGSLAHASPELHRRACRHIKEHGRRDDVPTLLAEINHPSTSVSRAALQGLAKLGDIEHAGRVRPLLTHAQPLVAVDAALTLDRWGDPTGTNALERLAVSGDRTTKLAVVQGIKNNLDRKYVPLLVRLLDESGTIRQEALDALPLVAGRDVVPPQEMAYYSTQERVALWKQWNRDGQVF